MYAIVMPLTVARIFSLPLPLPFCLLPYASGGGHPVYNPLLMKALTHFLLFLVASLCSHHDPIFNWFYLAGPVGVPYIDVQSQKIYTHRPLY